MAIDVVIDATIARPPAEVYARVTDLDAWPSWLIASGIVRVERSVDGPPSAGEELIVEQRAAGRAATFQAEITGIDPGRRLTLRGRDGDGVSIDIEATVQPHDGGTALRWSIAIGLPIRYRFFESMARPQVQRAAALDIEALRRRLESAAAD